MPGDTSCVTNTKISGDELVSDPSGLSSRYSSRNSEKEISSYRSEELDDVNKRVKDVFYILNRETNRVRKEMEALDEAAKKLEHAHFSKMLKLNVGGHFSRPAWQPSIMTQVGNFE